MWIRLAFAFCVACIVCPLVVRAQPATQPSSTVTGIVTAESEVPLSEMVVYLESPDPNRPLPPAPKEPATISQKGAEFQPKLTVVSVGQSVKFPNDEDRQIEHNVFSNSSAKRFDLGLYGPGKSESVTFDKPGAVFLYCSIHRHMDGVIYVSPTPYWSRVEKDGRYTIENIPAGKWTLKTWQRRRRFPEQTHEVSAETGKQSTINLELKRQSTINPELKSK